VLSDSFNVNEKLLSKSRSSSAFRGTSDSSLQVKVHTDVYLPLSNTFPIYNSQFATILEFCVHFYGRIATGAVEVEPSSGVTISGSLELGVSIFAAGLTLTG
jgi:hypothetical protein